MNELISRERNNTFVEPDLVSITILLSKMYLLIQRSSLNRGWMQQYDQQTLYCHVLEEYFYFVIVNIKSGYGQLNVSR